jgi:hypothetical protein
MSRRATTRALLSAGVAVITFLGTVAAAGNASAATSAAPNAGASRTIQKVGVGTYHPGAVGSGDPASISTEIPSFFDEEADEGLVARAARPRTGGPHRSLSGRDSATATGAQATDGTVVRNGPQVLRSYDGINHRDQRTAGGGNQFSLEPPDQALCVGNGKVVEAVNDAIRVRNPDGSSATGVVSLNAFYGYPPAINRTTGVFGPEITDPVCLFDPTTHSFFLVVLTLESTEDGELTGVNHLDIAVASDPTGTWNIYTLDATDDGTNGSPVHPHCPCIGDYPHIGVDANGFFLTTNEYSFFGPEFNSAQIYVFSKRSLARGDAQVLVTQFDTTGADRGLNGFTIWPAQSPSTDQYAGDSHGTEYFLSSNAAEEATGTTVDRSNSVVAWAMTNTRSVDSSSPSLTLSNTRVGVTTYAVPPKANQKPGSVPLAECLNDDPCATFLLGAPDAAKPEAESTLDSNDTRMQQTTYANGRLYGALDTAVTVGGATKAGIGWYIVKPEVRRDQIQVRLDAQGQLGLAGNNLTYPAIGVTSSGKGVMAFTLAGDGFFPTAAFSAFDGRTGAGAIFVAAAGVGPQDGFSGYKAFNNPPRPRWGDYGATAVDGGTIWIASEYIGQTCTLAQYVTTPFGSCGGTRTALANWGTRISQIRP